MYLSRKRLSFGALMADLYCLAIVVGPFEALYVVFAKRPVALWFAFALLLAFLIVTIAYHAKFSRALSLFTPGEIIFGRCWKDGEKWWANPYQASRGLMFGLVFIALVVWGNSWDSVADERFYTTLTLPAVLGRTFLLWAGLGGLLLMGAGKPQGAYVVAAWFAVSSLAGASGLSPGPESTARVIALVNAFVAFYAVGVGIFYSKRLEA